MKKDPTLQFSRKSVYQIWYAHSSAQWKRDPDELKSANILLEEAWRSRSSSSINVYAVEPIPLHDEEGFTAIAFALPELLRQWAGSIREISLDSACKLSNIRKK